VFPEEYLFSKDFGEKWLCWWNWGNNWGRGSERGKRYLGFEAGVLLWLGGRGSTQGTLPGGEERKKGGKRGTDSHEGDSPRVGICTADSLLQGGRRSCMGLLGRKVKGGGVAGNRTGASGEGLT